MLYLIPAYLSEQTPANAFPIYISEIIKSIDYYLVENEKTARKVIKFFAPEKKQSELKLFILNKHTKTQDLQEAKSLLLQGQDFGLLSEAGLPCIADPGNIMVSWAHENNIAVTPLIGPSSIILGLISSGFNGQQFTFHGYLPIDKNERKKEIQRLETLVNKTGYSQIFMETPYRNHSLFEDLIKNLRSDTLLCIAANINHPTEEFIQTHSLQEWKKRGIDLHKIPAIFILGKNPQ